MDLLKTFGPLIQSIAPTIATALGGPVAGMAVRALSSALIGHENGTEEDISAALSMATPDQLAAVKKIDADFKVQMKSLDIDLVRISADDRKSARDMQINTQSHIPSILATIVIGGFGAITAMKVFGISVSSDPTVQDLLTTLRDGVILILSFYFGSSSNSRDKDTMLYNSTPKE
jgi:hypothetical protein